jgi:heptaprenyl diphosphate synthase
VIRLQDIRHKFSYIKEQVEKKVFDSYLLKYIEKPMIDEEKLLILILIMDQLELSFKEMQNFALSTMLIQIALDTHEYITQYSINEKNRQLTVLTGDYFSGLYYKLLADSEDIAMIRALSYGVKEINEHKVFVYQNKTTDTDKLMSDIMIIESSLFVKVAEYFKVDNWSEFISHYLLFKRLLKEKSKFLQGGSTKIFEALQKAVFPKYADTFELSNVQRSKLIMIFDRYLDFSKQIIEKGIGQLPNLNEWFVSRISSLLKQHQPVAKTFVEEG